MPIKKAVITAAGWGTRFLPVTKSQPKEMLPVVDKPVIQYSVEDAIACGVELIIIVTALGKRAIEDYFDRSFELESLLENKGDTKMLEKIRRISEMAQICYVRQKQQMGLGHAVLTAKSVVGNEPFILFLPDDIFDEGDRVIKKMLDIYQRYNSTVLAVKKVSKQELNRYGIIKPKTIDDRVYQVTDLIEKPQPDEAPSDLAIMGRYVLMPEIFPALEKTLPGQNREIQLTDGLKDLVRTYPIYAYEFEGESYDAGTPLGWMETTLALALRNPDIGPTLKAFITNLMDSHSSKEKTGTIKHP